MRPLGRRSLGKIASLVWMDWKGLEGWDGTRGSHVTDRKERTEAKKEGRKSKEFTKDAEGGFGKPMAKRMREAWLGRRRMWFDGMELKVNGL